MAALVCDICGGKLVMGAGGIAVCDSCGMEYSQARMKEKVQEIKGVVRIDNTYMVDNWMKMGTSASQAGNWKEAYDYFTKVIEVEPENWRAIYEKGKAGAWQSTLGNLRIAELEQGVAMALEIISRSDLDEKEIVSVKNEFAVELFETNNAITDLMDERLNSLGTLYRDLNGRQIGETLLRHTTNAEKTEEAIALIASFEDDLSKNNVIRFKKRICDDLRAACRVVSCADNGEFGFYANEKKPYIDKYLNLVEDIRKVEPNFATDERSCLNPFEPGAFKSQDYHKYWKQYEKETLTKRRIDAYWAKYPDKKAALESQKKDYKKQIDELEEQREGGEIKELKEKYANLDAQCSDLKFKEAWKSIFKVKARRELREKIDGMNRELSTLMDTINGMEAEIDEKITPLQKKISEINKELTKER